MGTSVGDNVIKRIVEFDKRGEGQRGKGVGKPGIYFFNDDKKSMNLGYTKNGALGLYLYDALEKPRLINAVSANGDPIAAIYSHDTKELVGFGYEEGIPYLQFQHNEKNRILMGLSEKSGNGGLIFMNKYGKTVIDIGEGLNEGASMELNDKDGRSLVK